MMLIVLDKDAHSAANLIPDRLKFKQLIELGQLICGAGISDVFKPVRQGKALKEWIKSNPYWIYCYFGFLLDWACLHTKIKLETRYKLKCIKEDLWNSFEVCKHDIQTAIFRYKKEYECNFKSNIELPIDIAVEEYKKYIIWKGVRNDRNSKNHT